MKQSGIQVEQLNALIRTHDLQQLLNLARPVFGNPLILSNGAYTVMAITEEPDVDDPQWADISSTRGVPIGSVTCDHINQAYRQSLAGGRPVLDAENGGGPAMLRKTLAAGNRILGYLDSPLYLGRPDRDGVEFFDFLGNLIAVELQKDLSRAALPGHMLDYFVYDLLEGKLTDPKRIVERLAFFQWDLCAKGRVQVVSIHGQTGDRLLDNLRFRKLVERFSAAFPQFRTFAYTTDLKMLCPVDESLLHNQDFLDRLQTLLEEEGLVAGVSRPLALLQTLPDFNRQAVQAAKLGRRLHPERTVHFYDSYAIYHALHLASEEENIFQFCHSAVILLRDYDLAHETDLLESLRVYLTHNRSIGESAAALYIHRNTMNYRIARINELTRMDLNDPDVLGHLLFSFYALEYGKVFAKEDQSLPPPPALHDGML